MAFAVALAADLTALGTTSRTTDITFSIRFGCDDPDELLLLLLSLLLLLFFLFGGGAIGAAAAAPDLKGCVEQ